LWKDRQCARPAIPDAKNPLLHAACKKTLPHNGNQTYCSDECELEIRKRDDRHEYRTKNPLTIKQCARPGCVNTFPNRMGGPIYCEDCRALVTQEIKRRSELKTRERNRPKRAAQQAARRAKWSPEKHKEENAKICKRAKERNAEAAWLVIFWQMRPFASACNRRTFAIFLITVSSRPVS
jgi:hypothetical protein